MAATNAVAFKDGRKRLLALLGPTLKGRGFAHLKELSFGRGSPRAAEIISFGARRGGGGEFCFSFGVGVRFPEVEAILRPDGGDDLVTTIAKPLSVLKSSAGFPEWCFNCDREPGDMVREVIGDLDEYGLPFLRRYSSMSEVSRSLHSDDPRDWFVLDPEQRLMTLAAVEHVQGRPHDALRRLESAIAAMKEAPLKRRWPIEKLRERLISAVSS